MIFSGIFNLPWWGSLIVALVLTHITIAGVTIYLHRNQTHRALDLGPLPSHFFRFWLWLTTGMVTKEWVAVHRLHHAKCETEEDPHSPQVLGLDAVMWGGVGLYKKGARDQATLEKYGRNTPDDWLERNIYTPHSAKGILLMLALNLALFGLVPGLLIWITQMLWIPFWAAGIVNGVGHFWGYRNFDCEDAATNVFPIGLLIGGEELHNNHHSFATSAKFSTKWYEFDIGWGYIRFFEMIGQARVKKTIPKLRLAEAKSDCDAQTLQAILTNRYEVMKRYTRSLQRTCAEETRHLMARKAVNPTLRKRLSVWLSSDAQALPEQEKAELTQVLSECKPLATVYHMRMELAALWSRSTLSQEQLIKHLNDWCRRAEASGIEALEKFSRQLRSYA